MKTKLTLSANDAATIIAACKAEIDRNGWMMSVAVVDDAGRLLSLVRFDGAGYATPDTARRKAETSAITRKSTAEAEKSTRDRPTMMALVERIPLQGGVPVMHGKECVGAVGVSGGSSEDDERVALAGIQALTLRVE